PVLRKPPHGSPRKWREGISKQCPPRLRVGGKMVERASRPFHFGRQRLTPIVVERASSPFACFMTARRMPSGQKRAGSPFYFPSSSRTQERDASMRQSTSLYLGFESRVRFEDNTKRREAGIARIISQESELSDPRSQSV